MMRPRQIVRTRELRESTEDAGGVESRARESVSGGEVAPAVVSWSRRRAEQNVLNNHDRPSILTKVLSFSNFSREASTGSESVTSG